MNIVDIILALGLFWSARKGWQIGLVQSLLSLLSIVLAYGFALTYGESAARQLLDTTEELDGGSALLGFIAVFAFVLFACYIIGRALHKALMASPLGTIDAIGGGALGMAKGLLIFGLLTLFFRLYPIHSRVPALIEDSALGPPVENAALVIADMVKKAFPKTQNLLEGLGVQAEKAPPLVDKINQGAKEARKKIDELIDESREKLGK